jgi:bacterioferritin-associated ferredoxin
MDQSIRADIIDKLAKICICKGISRATIKNAIQNGARTVIEVQQATGAGTGSCCGRRCMSKIEKLFKET